MKLLIKKLWFRNSVDEVAESLFQIPQLKELFDEGYVYDGEMRPRGIKIFTMYWPADAILDRLPDPGKDVYLVLTTADLQGDYGRIDGKGRDRRAIMSNDSYLAGIKKDIFDPSDVNFNATAFGEIGHALGSEHHKFDPLNQCEMSHNYFPQAEWKFLEDIRLCDKCYEKIRRK